MSGMSGIFVLIYIIKSVSFLEHLHIWDAFACNALTLADLLLTGGNYLQNILSK